MKFNKQYITTLTLLTGILALLLGRQATVAGTWTNDKALTVWVFDVGQGDAIFIDGPDKQVLIDGGPDARILEKLSAVMPWWDRSIDLMVNTHPHADHDVGLVHVLPRYKASSVRDSGQGYGAPEYFEYEKLAPEHSPISAGEIIDLGGGATLNALWPKASYDDKVISDPNDGSVVFLLTYGDTTMLLTGDAGVAEEGEWGSLGHVDVLKVGHHGSRTSTSEELLQSITPSVAIISVGEGNSYGLPDEDVIDRLSRFGVTTYRTDVHKDVRMWTDGGEPSIRLFDL